MCRCHPLWIVHYGKIPFRYNYNSCSRPPTNYASNQSIHYFNRKKNVKITCKSPLILKKTHSQATQAFVSYDLVLFRSHSVTKTAATRAECEVSGAVALEAGVTLWDCVNEAFSFLPSCVFADRRSARLYTRRQQLWPCLYFCPSLMHYKWIPGLD